VKNAIVLVSLLFASLCAAEPAKKSLYQRLGGKPGITSLVGDYVDKLASDPKLLADPTLKDFKDKSNLGTLKSALTQRVCQVSGGPCGKKIAALPNAPKNLQLKPMQWMAAIQDLNSVLDQHHTPPAERSELLGLLLRAQTR
jgi:hemoglobin